MGSKSGRGEGGEQVGGGWRAGGEQMGSGWGQGAGGVRERVGVEERERSGWGAGGAGERVGLMSGRGADGVTPETSTHRPEGGRRCWASGVWAWRLSVACTAVRVVQNGARGVSAREGAEGVGVRASLSGDAHGLGV